MHVCRAGRQCVQHCRGLSEKSKQEADERIQYRRHKDAEYDDQRCQANGSSHDSARRQGELVEQLDLLRRTLCGHSSCGKLRVRDHRTCDRAYVFARGLPQEEEIVKDLNYYIALLCMVVKC